MKQLLAAGVVLLGLAMPAKSEEWLLCTDRQHTALIGVLIGSSKLISVSKIEMKAGGKTWSSGSEGAKIVLGQAFDTKDRMWIDVANDAQDIIAELRLFKASEGGVRMRGGTLRIAGVGAWAVGCTE